MRNNSYGNLIIGRVSAPRELSSLVGLVDALMVGGGLGGFDIYDKRCEFEIRAIKAAAGRGIPVAGVCHG